MAVASALKAVICDRPSLVNNPSALAKAVFHIVSSRVVTKKTGCRIAPAAGTTMKNLPC
jgi:hypothetical protein